jgi:hypothetical protein
MFEYCLNRKSQTTIEFLTLFIVMLLIIVLSYVILVPSIQVYSTGSYVSQSLPSSYGSLSVQMLVTNQSTVTLGLWHNFASNITVRQILLNDEVFFQGNSQIRATSTTPVLFSNVSFIQPTGSTYRFTVTLAYSVGIVNRTDSFPTRLTGSFR